MKDTILIGRGDRIDRISDAAWKGELSEVPGHTEAELRFMTEDHHRVRTFVVRELVRTARPLRSEAIARHLRLPPDRVEKIVEELEENLFFLVRNLQKEVTWAFPFTVDRTPHRLVFGSGERLWAA